MALTVIGFALSLAGVVLRGLAAGRAPWGNMFEFTISAMVFVVAVYLIMVWRAGVRWLGLPVTLLAAIGNGLAVTVFYVAVAPLVPALHSVWFIIHIVAAAISGAAFNIGGLLSILYLVKQRAEERDTRAAATSACCRPPRRLDVLAYRFLAFAFPLWTFAVAAGAIWAEYAWGRYWGWDPKETWAFVTWVIYAGYLHARSTAGWRGRRAAVIALIGLALVLVQLRRHQPVRQRPALLRRHLAATRGSRHGAQRRPPVVLAGAREHEPWLKGPKASWSPVVIAPCRSQAAGGGASIGRGADPADPALDPAHGVPCGRVRSAPGPAPVTPISAACWGEPYSFPG